MKYTTNSQKDLYLSTHFRTFRTTNKTVVKSFKCFVCACDLDTKSNEDATRERHTHTKMHTHGLNEMVGPTHIEAVTTTYMLTTNRLSTVQTFSLVFVYDMLTTFITYAYRVSNLTTNKYESYRLVICAIDIFQPWYCIYN